MKKITLLLAAILIIFGTMSMSGQGNNEEPRPEYVCEDISVI